MGETKRKSLLLLLLTKCLLFSEKISDQEEILRAAQKLKDEVIGKLVEELNNVEQDPLSGDQLETLMHQRGINMRILGRICTIVRRLLFKVMTIIIYFRLN